MGQVSAIKRHGAGDRDAQPRAQHRPGLFLALVPVNRRSRHRVEAHGRRPAAFVFRWRLPRDLCHRRETMLVTGLVLLVTVAIYTGAVVWLLYLRWPLRAGLAMAAIASLPLFIPQSADSEAPGSGLPTALLLLPALALIGGGLIAAVVRLALKLVRRRRSASLQKP